MGSKKKNKNNGVACGFPLIKLIKLAATDQNACDVLRKLHEASQKLLEDVQARGFPIATPELITLDNIHTRYCSLFKKTHLSGIAIKTTIDALPRDFKSLKSAARKSGIAKNL